MYREWNCIQWGAPPEAELEGRRTMTTKTSELSYRVHQSERSGGLEGSEQAREAMAQASEKYPCLPAGTVAPIALAQELALKWDTTVRRLPRNKKR